jgi:hypothetical protein
VRILLGVFLACLAYICLWGRKFNPQLDPSARYLIEKLIYISLSQQL